MKKQILHLHQDLIGFSPKAEASYSFWSVRNTWIPLEEKELFDLKAPLSPLNEIWALLSILMDFKYLEMINVENLEHCDFLALRNMLVCTHMMDLLEVTNNVHYENYRCQRLSGIGSSSEGHHDSQKKMDLRGNKPQAGSDGECTEGHSHSEAPGTCQENGNAHYFFLQNRDEELELGVLWLGKGNPLAQMEEEKKEHEKKMKQMEIEMEQVFEMKVQEKKQKMKDVELDLQRKHEERMRSLEAQEKELEERRRAFEIELKQWETANGVTMEELRRRSLEANSKETVDGKEKGKKKKGLF
ncbi:unnamed protein product [Darwinula stevensoni]|uniref:Septin-type G domain-containing protein n=1 Tax=Darwinula stevensoni TaxID=69355 RepID=A0A7R8X036_9CRUS|nr:unnamed protein product [Darwinula stevensoni]CAG0881242.1 unnamed protein product [Darwinula stevensoni]